MAASAKKQANAQQQALHLSDAPIDLNAIRENHRKHFKKIMDKIRGQNKWVVLKKEMLRLLNIVVGRVVKIKTAYLEEEVRFSPDATNVVYLIRPEVETMSLIVKQIQAKRRHVGVEDRKYHIVMIPSSSLRCRQVLEREGLLNQVEIIEFPLDLIPLDRDLITCALPNLLRSSIVYGDYQPLNHLARALLKLEIMYGRFTQIRGKGQLSTIVMKLMERFKRESDELLMIHDQPEIDQLILIDRLTDPITVLATQRTYEGIIDEIEGIANSHAEFDKDLLGKAGTGKTRDGKKKIALNSADRIFQRCRDLNFEYALGPWFSQASQDVKKYFDQRHEAKQDTSQLKKFFGMLGSRHEDHMKLTLHINIASDLGKKTNKFMPWKRQMRIESELLEGSSQEDPEQYVIELCGRGASFSRVLRLMCLTSLCRGGLRSYEALKKEILQTYGYHHMLTLQKMEKSGLLNSKKLLNFGAKEAKFNFAVLRKSLNLYETLTPKDYQGGQLGLRDLNAIGSNYAPLSGRIVETLHAHPKPEGWLEKLTQSLPGEYFSRTEGTMGDNSIPSERPKRIMVCFVGGVTYAEVSAIRMLEQRKPDEYQFMILGSSITSGEKFLSQFVSNTSKNVEEMLNQARRRFDVL